MSAEVGMSLEDPGVRNVSGNVAGLRAGGRDFILDVNYFDRSSLCLL
jgi:hypothetical protein